VREGGRACSKSEWERSSPNAASQASKISFSWLRATASRGADSTNEEWLNGENGLLLTPSIDHLFDRGFIGFENNGALIISPVAHRPSLQRMGIDTTAAINVGVFTSGQKQFLDFHIEVVLLQSNRG